MVQLGSKTGLFPEPMDGDYDSFEKIDPMIKKMKDIIEELMRRLWSGLRDVSSYGATGKPYLAIVVSKYGADDTDGQYNCTIWEYDSDFAVTEVTYPDSGSSAIVLNMVADYHNDKLLDADNRLICWRITNSDADAHKYVGIELFGRTTIGAC